MALYLVTGGAGFIGSSIAEALLLRGERVRILDDFSSGRRENLAGLPGRWELIEGSVVDSTIAAAAVRDVDVVFHQAAIPSVARSVEDPQATILAGVQGTAVLLDTARRAGVRRVVFAASSAAYGDGKELPKIETLAVQPLSPYAASKVAGEQLMRIFSDLYGLETISLRYFNVFGPRQDPKSEYAAVVPKFIRAALQNERPLVFGDGEQTRDFCYIDNVVRANLLAANTSRKLGGEVVNVACGERTSLNQLLAFIGDLAGVPLAPDYRAARAGDARHSHADIRAAKELLDYEPLVNVRDGLARTLTAFQRVAG